MMFVKVDVNADVDCYYEDGKKETSRIGCAFPLTTALFGRSFREEKVIQ